MPIAPLDGWIAGKVYAVHSTHDGAVQYAPIPADGDDYVYRIRTELTPTLTLAERVAELEESVRTLQAAFDALTALVKGDGG